MTGSAQRPALRELARRLGILDAYRDVRGEVVNATDATRERLCAALGHPAADEEQAAAALAALPNERPTRALRTRLACRAVRDVVGDRRVFGLWANLYSMRGTYGIGDFGDLRELIAFAADVGASFVGLNPLHAVRNIGQEVSPYGPISRLFRNELYLDLDRVVGRDPSPSVREASASAAHAAELERLRKSPRIDHEGCLRAKRRVLEAVWNERGEALAADLGSDPVLLDFATFRALEEHLFARGHARDWRVWPAELRHPRAPEVARFRRQHARRVDFHRWLQTELARQLEELARLAAAAGLRLGLYQDLAVASVASGFDTWAFPDVFVHDVRLGAPPDDYAASGQDWGLPPLDPLRLAEQDYAWWRRLLRSATLGSGALRIDHVMGLARQFWIPADRPAREGAYVRFPLEGLADALAEESRRSGAVVVGEDLGTVPEGFRQEMARRGLVRLCVLHFERDERGEFHPPEAYAEQALATVNTHDLPPFAGFWSGADLELRRAIGLLDDEELEDAQRLRAAERAALRRRLAAEGLLAPGASGGDVHDMLAGAHAFLARTPAALVGVSLDDLAGESEPVNVPGVGPECWPSWTRRMERSLAEVAADPRVARSLAGLATRGARRP